MIAALEGNDWSAARSGRNLPPGKHPVPILQEAGWTHGRSGRAENLVPSAIQSRNVQPLVKSLYRLSYQAHVLIYTLMISIVYLLVHSTKKTKDSRYMYWSNRLQYGLALRRFVLRRFTFTTLVESDRALPKCGASLSQLKRPFST